MILLHNLEGKEILVPVKHINFVEATDDGSKIELDNIFTECSFTYVRELPCQILLKINQNK